MQPDICYVVLFCLLMSSARSRFLSVSHHGPQMSIDGISKPLIWFYILSPLISGFCGISAKSYVLPIKLTCDDHLTREIVISGISLFKLKRTVEANHVFPGIHTESQAECQHTFHPLNGTFPAECSLRFSGRKLPSDVMIIAVYRCVTTGDPQKQVVRTRASETGDVVLRCGFNRMIDILNIKINDTDLLDEDKETMKQQCAMKMFQAPQQVPGLRRSVFCTVSKQGRKGELSVKYQCLHAPQKTRGQNVYHGTSARLLMRRHLRHFSEQRTYRRHKSRN